MLRYIITADFRENGKTTEITKDFDDLTEANNYILQFIYDNYLKYKYGAELYDSKLDKIITSIRGAYDDGI